MEKLRVAIINDWMGTSNSNPDEETEFVKGLLHRYLPEHEVVITGECVADIKDKLDILDLIICDYGGLTAAYGCRPRAEYEVKTLVTWAKEHPGKLLAINSSMTGRLLDDMKEEYPELAEVENIVVAGWDYDKFIEDICNKLGVEMQDND